MSNLPPGVTTSMIPGNRPEDLNHEAMWEAIIDSLPERFEAMKEVMVEIWESKDPAQFADRCANLINLFEPSKEEEAAGRRLGVAVDKCRVLERFMTHIEDAMVVALEWENGGPEPPEPDPYEDY